MTLAQGSKLAFKKFLTVTSTSKYTQAGLQSPRHYYCIRLCLESVSESRDEQQILQAFTFQKKTMDLSKEEIVKVLRSADCVCFDVDSTICPDEGIDEFANFFGVGDQVKAITKRAMDGSMTFQEALSERIKMINPSYNRLKMFLEKRTPRTTPGAKKLIDCLRKRGCHVYLVSGGFTEIIHPVAALLGVPRQDIKANRFLYYYTGECVGADERQPTCRSGGKAKAVELLREQNGYKSMIMIGDGATDLEACPPADAFIGFGGNVVRPVVKEKANWFVYSFREIFDELKDA